MKNYLLRMSLLGLLVVGPLPGLGAGLSDEIDKTFAALEPMQRLKNGKLNTAQDQQLFGGEIVIRAYEKAVFVATRTKGHARCESVALPEKRLDLKPPSKIRQFHASQGGEKAFGSLLTGPHYLFDGGFTIYIFQKGLIMSRSGRQRRADEALILQKRFR